jgi:hypothetical protein
MEGCVRSTRITPASMRNRRHNWIIFARLNVLTTFPSCMAISSCKTNIVKRIFSYLDYMTAEIKRKEKQRKFEVS